MLNRIQIKPNTFHNEHFWVCFMFTIFCIIFWTVSLSGFFMVLQIVCFYVSSLYIHLIQKNLTYFLPKKLCTRSRRTLFHCSWQYLLNTCLHSNKLMTGYITETFSFCASSLHWVHQPTAFYPILLQKWLLGKIQGYIQLKYVQKKNEYKRYWILNLELHLFHKVIVTLSYFQLHCSMTNQTKIENYHYDYYPQVAIDQNKAKYQMLPCNDVFS